jgi:nitrous oxidase accessory protein NosD
MAVASMPAATLAADAASCQPTGFVHDGINLTAAQIGGTVTTSLDATNCNIGVYNPTGVSGATIFGADYFGVVVNGVSANVTNSTVRNIGDDPVNGSQHGRAILYINGASGTISGNRVSAFQKNGIEVSSLTADASAVSSVKTSASVSNNVVTGAGDIAYIAQNGIVIRSGANATVVKNTVSGFDYTPAGTEATGLLLYEAGRVNVQNNTISGNEKDIFDAGFTGGHVKP